VLRYGFKKKANKIARAARSALGLEPHAPFDPRGLATHLNIPVIALSEFRDTHPGAVKHLMKRDPGAFSACTVHAGEKRLIVVNDGHATPRQSADVAHELSHVVLKHPIGPIFDERGCRVLDKVAEEEADWLGPALLVSDEAALFIARQNWTIKDAAQRYAVSEQVMRFRINVTAAIKRSAA
jgi:Zn-dependent peptidase ImmA (M78 family)